MSQFNERIIQWATDVLQLRQREMYGEKEHDPFEL